MKYSKIIIWGHPLHSHTHSYVHNAYFKALKYMGYNVYWFDDNNYPLDFDYDDSLFIGEGFADKNIPLRQNSCYLIMYCPSPKKYENVGDFYDVRMSAVNFKDHIYDYSLDKTKALNIGKCCFFEPKTNTKVKLKNNYVDYEIDDYNKLYISWATNLLPHEINYEDAYIKRYNIIHFCGSISDENYNNFVPFINACKENNIIFSQNNPWTNPISDEELIDKTKKSLLGVDIRSDKHVKQRLLTCRVFKNISYGHLGLTNSEEIYNELDGNCTYNSDTHQLFYDGLKDRKNYDSIINGMKYVKEHHTFINRIQSIFSILN